MYKYLLIAAFIFCSLNAGESHTIKSAKVHHAKWNIQEDGSAPKLLHFDLTLTIDDGQTFHANGLTDPKMMSVYQEGDAISIARQGLFIKDPSLSWFELEHQGNLYLFQGKRHLPPVEYIEGLHHFLFYLRIIPDNFLYLERKTQATLPSSEGWLHFRLKNYYFRLPIHDPYFHGFYEMMPIEILQEEISEPDSTGKRYCLMVFLNPLTGQQYSLVSDPFTDLKQGTVKDTSQKWENGYLYKTFHLVNDQSFIASYLSKDKLDSIREGDSIEIVKEERYLQSWSKFLIKNRRTNELCWFEGQTRKPAYYVYGNDIGYILKIDYSYMLNYDWYNGLTYKVKTTKGSFQFSYDAGDLLPGTHYPEENGDFANLLYLGMPLRFFSDGRIQDPEGGLTIKP